MKYLLILCMIIVLVVTSCNDSNKQQTGFNDKIYNYWQDGFVPDKMTAINVAVAILPPIYGKKVLNQTPFTAELIGDSMWIVEGTLAPGIKGG